MTPDTAELHRLLLEARETNRRLHRRTQEAESKLASAWMAGFMAEKRSDRQQAQWLRRRLAWFVWRYMT